MTATTNTRRSAKSRNAILAGKAAYALCTFNKSTGAGN